MNEWHRESGRHRACQDRSTEKREGESEKAKACGEGGVMGMLTGDGGCTDWGHICPPARAGRSLRISGRHHQHGRLTAGKAWASQPATVWPSTLRSWDKNRPQTEINTPRALISASLLSQALISQLLSSFLSALILSGEYNLFGVDVTAPQGKPC